MYLEFSNSSLESFCHLQLLCSFVWSERVIGLPAGAAHGAQVIFPIAPSLTADCSGTTVFDNESFLVN